MQEEEYQRNPDACPHCSTIGTDVMHGDYMCDNNPEHPKQVMLNHLFQKQAQGEAVGINYHAIVNQLLWGLQCAGYSVIKTSTQKVYAIVKQIKVVDEAGTLVTQEYIIRTFLEEMNAKNNAHDLNRNNPDNSPEYADYSVYTVKEFILE